MDGKCLKFGQMGGDPHPGFQLLDGIKNGGQIEQPDKVSTGEE